MNIRNIFLLIGCAMAAPVHAEAPDMPRSVIEVFHIAPGQHEAFLERIAQQERAAQAVGLDPGDLYIHEAGASWDFVLVKPLGQDDALWDQMMSRLHAEGYPSGPDFFFEFRTFYTAHEDTYVLGPTRATDYLATRTPAKQ